MTERETEAIMLYIEKLILHASKTPRKEPLNDYQRDIIAARLNQELYGDND